jgi:hypothetical protein
MGSTSQPVVTVLRKFLMQSQEQRHGVFNLAWDTGGPPC